MSALGAKRGYNTRFQNGDNESFDHSLYPQSKRQKQFQGNPDTPPSTPNNAVFERAPWDQQFCSFGWNRLGALLSDKSSGPSNGNTAGPSTTIAPTSTSLDQTLSLPAESYTSLCTDQNGYSSTADGIDEILRSSSSFNLSTQDVTSFPVHKHIEQITNDLNLQGNEQGPRIPRQQDQPWAPLVPNSHSNYYFQSNNRMGSTRPNSLNAGLTNGPTIRGQLGKARSEIGPLDSVHASWDFQNQSPEIRPTCSIPFNPTVQPFSNNRVESGLFTDSSMLVNDGARKQFGRDDWGSAPNMDTTSLLPDLATELPSVDGSPQGPPWDCSMCDHKFKNQSECKKHWLRHMKPYKCLEPGCNRPDGFSTRNDLDRHRKSLHKIATRNKTDKTYKCAAPNCNKRTKVWPRLDNFRQHCTRTHRDLATDDLVKQSEMPTSGQRCVSRTQRSNEDSPTPVLPHAPRDTSSLISAVTTNNLPSAHRRATEGHSNDTDNLCDEKSSVSAAPSASRSLSRYYPPLDLKDSPNSFVPHDPDMLRSSGLDIGSSRLLPRSMLSDGDIISERARLGRYTMPISRPPSYSTVCRSTHPLLVNPRLQGGYQSFGNHPFPNRNSCHRPRDTSLEKLGTRCLGYFQGRSRPPGYESARAPRAPARQSLTNETLKDAAPSMDLSRTASQEARKITHEVCTGETLSSQVVQNLQLKLQDSLQRSLESLENRYQDNLQRTLASLNLPKKDGEVRGRESENSKIAIDEERHKCLECNKVKKTHSDLKKHVLRHSRPYTCTDENCQLSFGSKNDWKRHERTIHDDPSLKQAFWCALRFDSIEDMKNRDKVMTSLDIEAIIDIRFDGMLPDPLIWEDGRCLEPDVPHTEACQFVAWRKEDFYEHLYTKHSVTKPVLSLTQLPSSSLSSPPRPSPPIPVCDPQHVPPKPPSHYTAAKKARKEIKMKCHIGRNGTNGFWCGFCNSVITIDRALRGAPAWDARYKHIDECHFREVGVKYFEEATRAEGVEGGGEQGSARGLSQANEGKQREEQQPWLPRRKGESWVVLGKGKTKGRLRYDEEQEERKKFERDTESDEDETDENDESGILEIASQHGEEDETAAATDRDHPTTITHPSTETRAPLSPRSAPPDPPPPAQPVPTTSIFSSRHDNELGNDGISPPANTRVPSQPPASANESILDEDYIANLGTTHPRLYPPPPHTRIQPPPPPQQQQQQRHTRSATSAATKLRWWRCCLCNDGPWDSRHSEWCGNGECVHHRCKACCGQARN